MEKLKSTNLQLALVFALALGLRILAAILIGDARVVWKYEYEGIAENLLSQGAYAYSFYDLTAARPTSFLPPVYPLSLAVARNGAGGGDFLLQTAQILLSSLTVISLYALARELGASAGQGVLAALLLALYPPAVAYAPLISTVTLETFFVITATGYVLWAAKGGSPLAPLAAGVLLALAALTRSSWLVLIPLSALWLIWVRRGHNPGWGRSIAWLLGGSLLFLLPWMAYNFTTLGQVRLTSTNGGLNFWIGNNPKATGEYLHPTTIDSQAVLRAADLSEPARDRYFYRLGWEHIRAAPLDFLGRSGRKLVYFLLFRPDLGSSYQTAALPLKLGRWLFILSWLAVLPFAALGLWTRDHWQGHLLLAAITLSQAVITMLTFAGTRFRTPIDGFALIWAALGLSALAGWRSQA
jgi:4-amino-4-deoxy-L-arabinose transferase-like glycosyltransferase